MMAPAAGGAAAPGIGPLKQMKQIRDQFDPLSTAIVDAWARQKGTVAIVEQLGPLPDDPNGWMEALVTSVIAMEEVLGRLRDLSDEFEFRLNQSTKLEG
ncbi:MAG TPA: hypothetical protein VF188_04595 [Longimicrobiales bacterium]